MGLFDRWRKKGGEDSEADMAVSGAEPAKTDDEAECAEPADGTECAKIADGAEAAAVNDDTESVIVAEEPESSKTDDELECAGTDDDSETDNDREKTGFFARLKAGLSKTRSSLAKGFGGLFSGFSSIDDDFYEELEELMIMADMGVNTTDAIMGRLKEKVKEQRIKQPSECRKLLIDSIQEQMDVGENAYEYEDRTSVLLVVGVNGVGKTTSIGKLASQMKNKGKKVLLAAADTFRAGAIEQLDVWAKRADVGIILSKEGQDPASVVFDACSASKARKSDILIVDTAGRLNNKKNLMEELRKIRRVIDRELPYAYKEALAVVDATTGQNALLQAREFCDVADVSGIILTKMDGTAKGGIAVAIQSELSIPVKYIGVGEGIDDLQKFDAQLYVDAMFAQDADSDAAQTKGV